MANLNQTKIITIQIRRKAIEQVHECSYQRQNEQMILYTRLKKDQGFLQLK